MFLFDEVALVDRMLVLNTGSITNTRQRIVDHIVFKYYGSIYLTTKSSVDQSICINIPISIMHVLLWRIHTRGWVAKRLSQNEPFIRT